MNLDVENVSLTGKTSQTPAPLSSVPLGKQAQCGSVSDPQGNVVAEGSHFHCANICFYHLLGFLTPYSKGPVSVPTEQKRCQAYVGNDQPVLISLCQRGVV